jgi:inorganic pyrophosphatase
MTEQIAHFFQHYKDLEKGKWVTIVRWLEASDAEELILKGIERAKRKTSYKVMTDGDSEV